MKFKGLLGGLCAVTLGVFTIQSVADENSATWVGLATQTCVAQAPSNRYIASLRMGQDQLNFSCRCVARDMLHILSSKERDELLRQIRQRQNLQAVGERMFERTEVKNAALTCSAAYYLWR